MSKHVEYSVYQEHSGTGDNIAGDKIVVNPGDAKNIITVEWIKNNSVKNVANLGARYSAALNVELGIPLYFDALLCTPQFKRRVESSIKQFAEGIERALSSQSVQLSTEAREGLGEKVGKMREALAVCFEGGSDLWSVESLSSFVIAARNQIRQLAEDSANKTDDRGHRKAAAVYRKLDERAVSCLSLVRGKMGDLVSNPILLLAGGPGIGKSHLLGDIVTKTLDDGRLAIFILGQHIRTEHAPWRQILEDNWRCPFSENEFLAIINEKGREQGHRVLLVIDALNEGRGKTVWPMHISGFLKNIKQYPWISIAVSLRSSYEELILPQDLKDTLGCVRVEHQGFSDYIYDAVSAFFDYYKLPLLRIPILTSEFSNPLYLKLYCESLKNKGLEKGLEGRRGITSVLSSLIDNVNARLSSENFYNYPQSINVVRQVLVSLVKHKEFSRAGISLPEAHMIADSISCKYSDKKNFIMALVDEGVLNLDVSAEDWEGSEFVYFAYERFEDYLQAMHLLDEQLDRLSGDTRWSPDWRQLALHQGLLEALAIILPEKKGKEIYEVLKLEGGHARHQVSLAFIASLLWRGRETISPVTVRRVEELFKESAYSQDVLGALYCVAGDPSHPLNADFLHSVLSPYPMATRDAFWIPLLHDQLDRGGVIDRLIDWTSKEHGDQVLSEEARLLSGQALSWLFASTNNVLRDRATHSLVSLLTENLKVAMRLLRKMISVNDFYVLERCLAGIYGATIRSMNIEGLSELARCVAVEIFDHTDQFVNVLVRDYARNIVEYAVYREKLDSALLKSVQPPYKSKFPDCFPTNEEVDAYEELDSGDSYGARSIMKSMITEYGRGICRYGDFGRYVFQSAIRNWTQFDPNDLSNYACTLIFDKYCYDPSVHGEFDRYASRGDRMNNKTERIGKKYQWLSLYEIVSLLADNHPQQPEFDNDGNGGQFYQGPWEGWLRNIDPSALNSKSQLKEREISELRTVLESGWGDGEGVWSRLGQETLDPASLIDIGEYVALERHVSWREPILDESYSSDDPQKYYWFQIRSYLVKSEDYSRVFEWLKKQHFMGRYLPEAPGADNIFANEIYWAPAFDACQTPYYGFGWCSLNTAGLGEVYPSAIEYRSDRGHAFTPHFYAPAMPIAAGAGLTNSKCPGEWCDRNGVIASTNLGLFSEDYSGVIISKEVLHNALMNQGLKIVWTFLGEKGVYMKDYSVKKEQRIELSGVYAMQDGAIYGKIHSQVQS